MLKFPPFIEEKFADNGAHSHYELIGPDGETLWSEPEDAPPESGAQPPQADNSQRAMVYVVQKF